MWCSESFLMIAVQINGLLVSWSAGFAYQLQADEDETSGHSRKARSTNGELTVPVMAIPEPLATNRDCNLYARPLGHDRQPLDLFTSQPDVGVDPGCANRW